MEHATVCLDTLAHLVRMVRPIAFSKGIICVSLKSVLMEPLVLSAWEIVLVRQAELEVLSVIM